MDTQKKESDVIFRTLASMTGFAGLMLLVLGTTNGLAALGVVLILTTGVAHAVLLGFREQEELKAKGRKAAKSVVTGPWIGKAS